MATNPEDFTKVIDGIRVYVQPGGCIEFGTTDFQGEEDLVHICSGMWSEIQQAVEELVKRRNIT